MPDKEKLFILKELSRRYSTADIETTALRKIYLEIHKGEFISIMGPSGGGKTTLLNILGLLDIPDEGSIFYRGTDMSNFSEMKRTRHRRGEIGFVFQNFNLIDELNVGENVELPLFFLGKSRKERKQKVERILTELKISHRASHYPQQLSGGQQQRIALSRALITEPDVLIADEPTGNLDSKAGMHILKLLAEINRNGTTIIMATHSYRDASFAHRIIHLYDGSIIVPDSKGPVNQSILV
jgi:putative ABC transport system ATP-binding protein